MMLTNSIRLKEGHEPTPNVQLLDTADFPLDIKQLAVKVIATLKE